MAKRTYQAIDKTIDLMLALHKKEQGKTMKKVLVNKEEKTC